MKKAAKKAARASRSKTAKPRARTDHAVCDPANPDRTLKLTLPAKPSPSDQAEAQHHVETLEANRQIARGPGTMPPGTTHRVESDASGQRRLVRKRFSAT
jgi:hypothetical protein